MGEDQYFGYSVASAGDLDGDGFTDSVIGAPDGQSYDGRAYIYFGGEAGPGTSPDVSLHGTAPGEYFGASVASAGDVNGDGFADSVVGAYGADSAADGPTCSSEARPGPTPARASRSTAKRPRMASARRWRASAT